MAAPITHIVLTDKIFDKFFKDKINQDFFVGTLFPDIRYLKVIDRDKTHYNNLSIADLENNESFLAGVKFHSILDQVREKFIVDNNTYAWCPKSQYITQSLKILEDEIFYSKVKDWTLYINYLNEILKSEREYGIADSDLKLWHSLLQQYFKKQPDPETVKNFTFSIGFSSEVALEINESIDQMKNNKKIINILEKLYKNFDTLLT